MPIDPSIPLSVKPAEFMSPAQMINLRNLQRQGQIQELQLSESQRQLRARNQMLQLMGQPGAIDPSGAPTPQTIQGAYQIGPEQGIQLSQVASSLETAQARRQQLQEQYAEKKGAFAKDTGRALVQAYDQAMTETGGNQQEALKRAQKVQNDLIDEAKQSGRWKGLGFGDQDEQNARNNVPDIEKLRAHFFTPAEMATEAKRDQWSEPYQMGGATVQKNKVTGEIRTAVSRPPITNVYGAKGKPPVGYRWGPEDEKGEPTLVPVTGGPADVGKSAEETAQAIANYQLPMLSGWVLKSPWGQRVMGQVTKLNPQYDARLYKAGEKAITDIAGGKTGAMTRSFNVAIQHTDVLRDAAKALDNGDIQLFNRVAQQIAQQTGSEVPTNFDAVKRIYADEIVKAIVASGGGAGGALADREEAARTITRAQSPKQLMGVMDQYINLMAGQVAGVKKQYEAASGRKDYEKYLMPATIKALGEHGYKTESMPTDIKSSVEKSGWSYEPDKYEYRVSPDGKVQRRAKGG